MEMTLNLRQNLDDFGEFYAMLDESHAGLDRGEQGNLNAQLVLLLSNHIGNMGVLRQAFAVARVKVEMMRPGAGSA
jgi:hypothetical protein